MKNDHATKKHRKQRLQATAPVGAQPQQQPESNGYQAATDADDGTLTPHSALGIPHSKRRRTGNVARLPKAVRDQVNQMLDDGVEYLEIIESIGEHGSELNEDIMHRWKKGGYQDYLRERRVLEQCRLRREHAFGLLAGNHHVNGFQATQQIASAQICEVVTDLGTDILREALIANPLNYFRMLNSFSRLANGGLRCERHLADEAERQVRLESAKSNPKKGITPESVKEMEEKINLM